VDQLLGPGKSSPTVCVCATVCTSNRSATVALGAWISRCQQMVIQGSRAATGQTMCLSPAAGGIHTVCTYIYSHSLTSILLSQKEEQDEAVGAAYVCVGVVCVSVICVAGNMCMHVCNVYLCLVCVPAENTSAASLSVRLGDTEQHLPCLSRVVGYVFFQRNYPPQLNTNCLY